MCQNCAHLPQAHSCWKRDRQKTPLHGSGISTVTDLEPTLLELESTFWAHAMPPNGAVWFAVPLLELDHIGIVNSVNVVSANEYTPPGIYDPRTTLCFTL